MKNFLKAAFALATLSVGAMGSASATLIVSGDATPFFNADAIGDANSDGGRQLLTNILGSSTEVRLNTDSVIGNIRDDIRNFYNTLTGVTATNLDIIESDSLLGVDLFVIVTPASEYSDQEADAIGDFLDSGGTLLLAGDPAGTIAPNVGFVNELLSDLGVAISLIDQSLEVGSQTATGAQLANNPLTAGIVSLSYGAAAPVVGGTALINLQDGRPFMAVLGEETMPEVPIPAAAFLFAPVLVALRWARSRTNS